MTNFREETSQFCHNKSFTMDEKVVEIIFGNVKLIQPQKFTHSVLDIKLLRFLSYSFYDFGELQEVLISPSLY